MYSLKNSTKVIMNTMLQKGIFKKKSYTCHQGREISQYTILLVNCIILKGFKNTRIDWQYFDTFKDSSKNGQKINEQCGFRCLWYTVSRLLHVSKLTTYLSFTFLFEIPVQSTMLNN